MRFFVHCFGYSGHVNALLGLVRRLVDAGHVVGWLAEDPRRTADPVKVPVPPGTVEIVVKHEGSPPEGPHPGHVGPYVDTVMARDAARAWSDVIAYGLPGLMRAVEEFRPDVMVVDGYLWHGLIAGHLSKIPYVSVGTGLHFLAPDGFQFPIEKLELPSLKPEFDALFARHGMQCERREMYAFSPHLNIVFSTEAFVGPDVVRPPMTHLVGPAVATEERSGEAGDFPWSKLRSDRPVVFASLGTVFGPDAELFVRLAAAAADLGVQLVLKVGGLRHRLFLAELPGDVLAVEYAPQIELLERVAAVITHGGANSVMEAMYQGCPVMVVPYGIDQELQAYFVDHAGPDAPGIAMSRYATTSELRDALRRLIEPDGPLRRNARRVQASYRESDGAQRAADLVIALGEGRSA